MVWQVNPNWDSPYYIHDTIINGAYKLRTIEGQVLKRQLMVAYLNCIVIDIFEK